MDGSSIVLVLSQLLVVVSALLVAFHPNILYASISLLFTFMGVAFLFVFAGADFLAGAQVVVYVGGVTILVLFAIMLTHWMYKVSLRDVSTKMAVPCLLGVGIFIVLFRAMNRLSSTMATIPQDQLDAFTASPKTKLIGEALLGNYLLPFEGITILLMGALVGACWIARPTE